MNIRGIHHVSINVDDVDAAVEFYTKMLGFNLRSDRPDFGFDGAWLDVANQQVHLIRAETPAALGQHYAVLVEDIDAAVTELRSRGVSVGDPSPVGSSRQAFLSDPSGNAIELHERPI